jgi:GTP-sensing pleiotropic transcriptional regulator CodY
MIADLLKQDCNIISTTKNMLGENVKSTPAGAKCRVKEKYKLVKNKAAQEVVSQLQFWFSADANVKLDDLIQFNSKEYPVISIQNKRDTLGCLIYKVVFV